MNISLRSLSLSKKASMQKIKAKTYFPQNLITKVRGNSKWQHKVMTLCIKIRLRQNQTALEHYVKNIENSFIDLSRLL